MSAHNHYFKDVAHLKHIDVYRVLALFNVTDPSLQHAIKKLLVAGGRGAGKDIDKDVQEAVDSLQRFQQMRNEDRVQVHDWPTFEAFQQMKRNAALPLGDPNGDAARRWLAEMQAVQPAPTVELTHVYTSGKLKPKRVAITKEAIASVRKRAGCTAAQARDALLVSGGRIRAAAESLMEGK